MMRRKIWGLLLIVAAAALVISRLDLKYSVPLGFWQVAGTLFFGAGVVDGLTRRKVATTVFSAAFILIIYQSELGIERIGTWTILGAALLLTLGLDMIFKHNVNIRINGKFDADDDDGVIIEGEGGFIDGETETQTDDVIEIDSLMNTTARYIQSQNLRKVNVNAKMSDVRIYLDNASLRDGRAVVNLEVSLGDVNIYVPRYWRVYNSVRTVLGEMSEKGNPTGDGMQELTLRGNVNLGAVTLHYV